MSKKNKPFDFEGILKNNGFRTTQPRRAILDLLMKTDHHIMAKEIYLKINKEYPDLGLTTIYRTLDLFNKAGLINKFEFGDGQSRYELAGNFKEHHHHLVCSNCGKIIDYNDFISEEIKFFDKIQRILSKKYKFNILNHEVSFYGTCDSCSKN